MVEDLLPKCVRTISSANRTVCALEAGYLNYVDANAPRIMYTAVPVEPRADISDAVLPAGIEVEFDLVRISPTVDWVWVRRKM